MRRVEAARAGTIFAHDDKAYQRWQRRRRMHPQATTGSGGGALTGAELEHVLMAMLTSNPDIVAVRQVH